MNKCLWIVLALLTNGMCKAQISDFGNISFNNADRIAASYKGKDLKNISELTYNLTNSLPTDVEKFRAIYIWVSTNIASDYHSFRKNYVKRRKFQNDSLQLKNWEREFNRAVFKKLVKEKKTVCTGYAYLIKKMANSAHINCEIVNGYGRLSNSIDNLQFPNHSWNAVSLNNKWYLCDATWSSGIFDVEANTFRFNYNDGYFLPNPQLFATNHFPVDSSWFLLNEKPILSDFAKAPIIYGNAFTYALFPIQPSVLFLEVQKNEAVLFTLKEIQPIDTKSIYLEIRSGNSLKYIQANFERDKNGLLQIKKHFTERGLYDVHIKVKNDVICTYTVKVKT